MKDLIMDVKGKEMNVTTRKSSSSYILIITLTTFSGALLYGLYIFYKMMRSSI